MSSSVRISRRLRPLRLAFLVDPRDRSAVLRVIEANTCVWGGRFNAIVPRLRAGIRDSNSRWTADEVVSGYLHRFEPDFLVDLTGDGRRLFDPDRVLAEKDVLDRERNGHVEYGINILAVCRHVYKKDYRFVRRQQEQFMLPVVPKAARAYDMFLGAVFGRYPENIEYFSRNFQEAFDASHDVLGPGTLLSSMEKRTPLKLTGAGVDSQGYSGPAVFLLDGKRASDVIDYWNLRALGWDLLPFPIQWREALFDGAKKFLHQQLSYYGSHKGLRVPKMLLAARSLGAATIREYREAFGAGAPCPLASQDWYPPLWNRWAQSHDVERCELTAGSDELDCAVEGTSEAPYASMAPLAPPFELRFPMLRDVQWANVVSVSSNTPISLVPPVVPTPLDVATAFGHVLRRGIAVMGEGIVLYGGRSSRHFLSLPSPAATSKAWFKAQGYSAETSSAGRIVLTMVRSLRGLFTIHTKNMVHRELLEYLNGLSHGLAGTSEQTERRAKATTRARTVSHGALLGFLKKLHKNKHELADEHLTQLVQAGVLRVGLELQCPECTQSTWFALDAIRDSLRCERCLADFTFPSAHPPGRDAWCYRTQGPFSIEGYEPRHQTETTTYAHPGTFLPRSAKRFELRLERERSNAAATALGPAASRRRLTARGCNIMLHSTQKGAR